MEVKAMSISYLGIDVAKLSLEAAFLIEEKVYHKSVPNNKDGFEQLHNWLISRSVDGIHICMEATNWYWERVANYFFKAGCKVSVVNPRQTKRFADSELKRSKDDRIDAGVIARFCRAMRPGSWQPLPYPLYELKYLVRRLDDLKKMRQEEKNHLEDEELPPSVQQSIHKNLASLEAELKAVMGKIKEVIEKDSTLKEQHNLLKTIPGIADLTAAVILGEAGDLTSYDSARSLAAQAGVIPRKADSGKKKGKAVMSKVGNSKLRKALYFPAMVAQKYNPIIKSFCARLEKRGMAKKAIIGAAMRKLLHLAYGVVKTKEAFNENYFPKRLDLR
jgi:transposase